MGSAEPINLPKKKVNDLSWAYLPEELLRELGCGGTATGRPKQLREAACFQSQVSMSSSRKRKIALAFQELFQLATEKRAKEWQY